MIDIALLKTAFRKLLTYSYFDRSDLALRRRVAEFANSLKPFEHENEVFENILSVANGDDDNSLNDWLDKMKLSYYPKVIKEEGLTVSNHIITNIPGERAFVERLLIKVDIPIELMIMDVAWLMEFGYLIDAGLYKNSWGNRLDLIPNHSGVRKGNSLFLKYHNQYRKWWGEGIKVANNKLKDHQDVTIVNFDITNYYHSINFEFENLFLYLETQCPHIDFRNNTLTKTIIKIYEHYWLMTQESDAFPFTGINQGKKPLPLSLMSAHVLANWYLDPLDRYIENLHPLYYGRYVDDCMVVLETQSTSDDTLESILQEIPGLFVKRDNAIKFAIGDNEAYDRLASLTLQEEKLYIYRFNCELPHASIEEYVQDQMERSSEFRFITDEGNNEAIGLEFVTLISALEADEEYGRRFNLLEENKYKLSVYLAKLASKLVRYGNEYEHYDEVDKLFHYFSGSLLMKHYQKWEMFLTVFVLGGRKDYVKEFYKKIKSQIAKLKVVDHVFEDNPALGLSRLKEVLTNHLEQSKLMALSLERGRSRADSIYLDTLMMRMHYNIYPMQEFAKRFSVDGVRLNTTNLQYDYSLLNYRWMPYYVKLYELIAMLSIGKKYSRDIFEKAYHYYRLLNHFGFDHDRNVLFRFPKEHPEVSEFNTTISNEDCKDNITVSVVNMDVTDDDLGRLIDNYGIIDVKKVKKMQLILDHITMVNETDIFIQPELTLPEYELMEYCRYSANHEVAFTSGMEYVVKGGSVYNYIVTCLPVTIYGVKDAVPVIRLKNFYAPKEVDIITGKGYTVPKNQRMWQNLYHWRDHLFTTYYCYELASIKHRSYFFNKIDAIYCPVFNPDTYYFNNISESLARDMHCYFIMGNVSHYGDSRITQPASHVYMNMLKIKGGNTKENMVSVLSAVIDTETLRSFQKLTHELQKEYLKQHEECKLKQTPPGYSKEGVLLREYANRFVYKWKDWEDEYLLNLCQSNMEY